ncbi:hypothetical protein [uncultured Tateyamaria sp.]|uniref:hypothetical protein n=1 Tax=uncultured Tateyamaria sp. TaxID=455651 RepID=UPI002630DDF5|nr:hypothetical protein [uncultured Tateyamaria sp.]
MDQFDHPFFAPPWRRCATVAVCILWGLFELWNGTVLWGILFLCIGMFAQRQFGLVDWSKYDAGE